MLHLKTKTSVDIDDQMEAAVDKLVEGEDESFQGIYFDLRKLSDEIAETSLGHYYTNPYQVYQACCLVTS